MAIVTVFSGRVYDKSRSRKRRFEKDNVKNKASVCNGAGDNHNDSIRAAG